jgi:hypothetical protein
LNLWKIAGINIEAEKGPSYRDIGQGMGRPSTWRRRATHMCSRTAAPGSLSRTKATS